jgi:hypothetical protein
MPVDGSYPDPQVENQMFSQLNAWSQRRTGYQLNASPQLTAAIGRVYQSQPDMRPGVALAAGQAIVASPGSEGALTQAAQYAQGAKVTQDILSELQRRQTQAASFGRPSYDASQVKANKAVADIPGLTPEQKAAESSGADLANAPLNPDQMKQERQALGIPEPVAPTPFDWTSPGDYFSAGTDALKTTVRTGVAVGQSGVETIQNLYANRAPMSYDAIQAVGGNKQVQDMLNEKYQRLNQQGFTGQITAPLEATTVGQMVTKGLSPGEGFIPNPQSPAGQYQSAAAREVRGVVPGTQTAANPNGQAWTFGRQLAASVTQPGTTQYNLLSGVADAAATWMGDPFNIAARNVAGIRAASKVITPIADVAGADAVAAQGADALVNGVRPTIYSKAAEQLLVHPRMLNVIDRTAATSDPLEIFNMYGRKLAPEVVTQLKNASTPEQVTAVLRGQLGLSLGSTDAIPAFARHVQVTRSVTSWLPGFDQLGEPTNQVTRALLYPTQGRYLGDMPSEMVDLSNNASDATRIAGINNVDRYLATAKVPYEQRATLVGNLIDAWSSGMSTAKGRAVDAVEAALNDAMVANGTDAGVARSLTSFVRDETPRLWGVDATGRPTDFNMLVLPDGSSADLSVVGPHLLSEGLNSKVYLPDLRTVRRLTSPFSKVLAVQGVNDAAFRQLLGSETGQKAIQLLASTDDPEAVKQTLSGVLRKTPSDALVDQVTAADNVKDVATALRPQLTTAKQTAGALRMPLSLAEWYQGKVWKPITILRPATTLRIVGDEQVRIAASGYTSAFRHPLDWIMMVTGHHANVDALGLDFNESQAMGFADQYRDALGSHYFTNLADPAMADRHAYVNGGWAIAQPGDTNYVDGLNSELRQLSRDPNAARYAQGKSTDQIVDWLHSPDGRPTFDELLQRGKTGFVMGNGAPRQVVDFTDDQALRQYLESVRTRLMLKTGGDAELLNAVGSNIMGADEKLVPHGELRVIKPGPTAPVDPFADPLGPTSTWMSSVVRHTDPETGQTRLGTIVGRGVHVGEPDSARVSFGSQAWQNGQPSEAFMQKLGEFAASDNAPDAVKYASTIRVRNPRAGTLKLQMDGATEHMFSALFDTPIATLTRSPLFRQAYYNELAGLAEHLAPEEANRLIQNLGADAEAKGFLGRLGNFVGDKTVDNVITSAGRANGTLALNDIDQVAKGRALDEVKRLLYDSSQRSNLSDAFRVVAPFAEAWKKILTSWAGIITRNPYVVRRGAAIVQGARDAGFFQTDTNGNEVFNYPGMALLGGVLGVLPGMSNPADTGAQFGAEAKGLNIAGNFLPGVGPVVQIPAWYLLKDQPQADMVRGLIAPYGEPPNLQSQLVPGWLSKIVGAVTDDPNSTGIYGNTYIETLQSLKASGNYPDTPDGRSRLEADARQKARTLAVLRGIGQAFLPSAPSPNFTVPTNQGDMLTTKLAADYAQMYQADPSTAVQRFVDTYGEGPFVYAISKTRAQNGGLSPSQAFGDWERENPGLMSRYKNVAGFFAPVGSDFDSAVYQRQLATGERKKLSDEDYLNVVDTTLGRWKYNQAKEQIGPKPNQAQRDWLAGYKQALQKDYPGFIEAPPTTDLQTKIAQLGQAANDPALADNNIAIAVRGYMALRDQALAVAKTRKLNSLGGKKAADLRDWLDGAGMAIAKDTPEFQRVFDSLLAAEVAN